MTMNMTMMINDDDQWGQFFYMACLVLIQRGDDHNDDEDDDDNDNEDDDDDDNDNDNDKWQQMTNVSTLQQMTNDSKRMMMIRRLQLNILKKKLTIWDNGF